MKLRRFSQLGWHGCMDLVAAAAGHHVVRVELGEAPKMTGECLTCGRTRTLSELRTVKPGDGVYRGPGDWVECVPRDAKGECAP